MKKFGEFICKHKIAILIIAVLLCIPSIYGMMATRVNYDINPVKRFWYGIIFNSTRKRYTAKESNQS